MSESQWRKLLGQLKLTDGTNVHMLIRMKQEGVSKEDLMRPGAKRTGFVLLNFPVSVA